MKPNKEIYYHAGSARDRVNQLINDGKQAVSFYRDRQDGHLVFVVEW